MAEQREKVAVTNPSCGDGGPSWCCIDGDGTGLWCPSCLRHGMTTEGGGS